MTRSLSVSSPHSTEPVRYRSLDGLRGVAALVVVVHHVLLTHPQLANGYQPPVAIDRSTWSWWLLFTPLHLPWAGGEAVLVFFVLSGLVLSLPFGSPSEWGRFRGDYFLRRAARLYVPVWVALVAALALAQVAHSTMIPGASWWLNAALKPPTLLGIATSAVLYPYPTEVISVLWSLKWEVLFSASLPSYLGICVSMRRLGLVVNFVVLLAAVVLGAFLREDALRFMPIFGLGVLLAAFRNELQESFGRLTAVSWAGLFGASLVMLVAPWLAVGCGFSAERPVMKALLFGAAVLGAALLVFCSWLWKPLVRMLEAPFFQWLGARSYSMYLVHLPVVTLVARLVGGWNSFSLPLVLTGTVALTEVFFRFVEHPSISLSRSVTKRLSVSSDGGPRGVGT